MGNLVEGGDLFICQVLFYSLPTPNPWVESRGGGTRVTAPPPEYGSGGEGHRVENGDLVHLHGRGVYKFLLLISPLTVEFHLF